MIIKQKIFKNDYILQENKKNNYVYFILSGEFEVYINKSIKELNVILDKVGNGFDIDTDLPKCEYLQEKKKFSASAAATFG